MRETQHPRTHLAWSRTSMALIAVALVEVRVLLGPEPTAVLWTLGGALALVVVGGTVAALRARRHADVRGVAQDSAGGRAPTLLAAVAVLVAALGMVAVITQDTLVSR